MIQTAKEFLINFMLRLRVLNILCVSHTFASMRFKNHSNFIVRLRVLCISLVWHWFVTIRLKKHVIPYEIHDTVPCS